jgi:hypothetical protein
VTVEYRASETRHTPAAFPTPPDPPPPPPRPVLVRQTISLGVVERARRYLARVEPAVAGQHGDLHTFRVCCRIVRGFPLSEEEAMAVLTDWNSRCEPPWSERELRDKIDRARRYGKEQIGGLSVARP